MPTMLGGVVNTCSTRWNKMHPKVVNRGFNMKYISLLVLVIQNSSLVLLLRYSRTVSGEQYISSTAVFLTEVVKIACSIGLLHYETECDSKKTAESIYEIFIRFTETVWVAVPAFLYTIQNNLLYVALTKLDAATYQVSYQLKLLTTALFSVTMLNKKLTPIQWVALCILTVAVALVQFPANGKLGALLQVGGLDMDQLVGLLAVVAACVTSGFSGVYFEKILKTTKTSLWIRNVQLGLFSMAFSGIGVIVHDWSAIKNNGFFQGYSWIVAVVILLQAIGGLLVAVVIKHAGNILKGFAAATSIVISSIISYFFLHFEPSPLFLIGAVLVIISTLMYAKYNPETEPPLDKSKSSNHSVIV